MNIIENYVQAFSKLGLSFSIEDNASPASEYQKIAILITKGGKRFGLKFFQDSHCLHVLPWERSDSIVRNKDKYYSLLLSFCFEIAQKNTLLLFAQRMPWNQFYANCEERLFSSFFLIQEHDAPALCEMLQISKRCGGWLQGEIDNKVVLASNRLNSIHTLIQSLTQSEPHNSYTLSRRKISTYIDGEEGTFDFCLSDKVLYTPRGGAVYEMLVSPDMSYVDALADAFQKVKIRRRLINLYEPPLKYFKRMISYNAYLNSNSHLILNVFDELYGGWESRERACLNIIETNDFSSYHNNYVHCQRYGKLFFIYDEESVFVHMHSPNLEEVSSLIERYTIQSIQKNIKNDVLAAIG